MRGCYGVTVLCEPRCGFRDARRKKRRADDDVPGPSEADLVIGSFEEVGLSDVLRAMSR
jgi:hypothetical protein